MKAITVPIGIFLFVASAIANAGIVETSAFTIEKLRISDNSGYAYIDPVGGIQAINSSCSGTVLYALNKTDELFNQHYTTALAALVSGREIKVWISNDVDDCIATHQRIRSIELQ